MIFVEDAGMLDGKQVNAKRRAVSRDLPTRNVASDPWRCCDLARPESLRDHTEIRSVIPSIPQCD